MSAHPRSVRENNTHACPLITSLALLLLIHWMFNHPCAHPCAAHFPHYVKAQLSSDPSLMLSLTLFYAESLSLCLGMCSSIQAHCDALAHSCRKHGGKFSVCSLSWADASLSPLFVHCVPSLHRHLFTQQDGGTQDPEFSIDSLRRATSLPLQLVQARRYSVAPLQLCFVYGWKCLASDTTRIYPRNGQENNWA